MTSSACSSQVEPGNEPALNFYRRLGFEAFTKYHTPIDRVAGVLKRDILGFFKFLLSHYVTFTNSNLLIPWCNSDYDRLARKRSTKSDGQCD